MARKNITVARAVAESVTDAVTTTIDALAHPATTMAQARDAIFGATRKAATAAGRQSTTAKRKVAAKKARRKVAAKKGAAKRTIKKVAKKVRRR